MNREDNPALLLIDIQKGMDEIDYFGGERNNPEAESNASRLLSYWRDHRLPVFHVQHCSTNPLSPLAEGKPGNELKDEVKPLPGEPLIKKNVNSAFIGTDLKEQLDQKKITRLVIVGLTTEHCVSTTTRMAGNFGFETYLVADATAAFNKITSEGKKFSAQTIHDTAIAMIENEFATVVKTNELIDQLEKS